MPRRKTRLLRIVPVIAGLTRFSNQTVEVDEDLAEHLVEVGYATDVTSASSRRKAEGVKAPDEEDES